MDKSIIIGVSGGSGSGKTFFAQNLLRKVGHESACLVYQDNYYIDQSHRFDHDGGSVNFDHPESLDFNLMGDHLSSLKIGNTVQIPTYDFATHSRKVETVSLTPKKLILVDGILILSQPNLRDIFDISIFIETPEEIRFARRLARDTQERGRTAEGVKNQFEAQVKPMHDLFVEPSKEHANHICSGTDMEAFHNLLAIIQSRIN